MRKLTANSIVSAINQLDKNVDYHYINEKNKMRIRIMEVHTPEGPIKIKRWNPSEGETPDKKNVDSISTELIWRVAAAFTENQPVNLDRVLGASYNTRSVLEALIAHTPEFHFCYPGRIENTGGQSKIKEGHKHLLWNPNEVHKLGVLHKIETGAAISEVSLEAYYESLVLPTNIPSPDLPIETVRMHARMQVALYTIGLQLNFKTWIAANDKGIVYGDKILGEAEGVIANLKDVQQISNYADAMHAARLIDCIWFKNGRLMPAVMEVEHSTGVTSGLTRMKNFKDLAPPFPTRYVVVASDDDRDKVVQEANKEQFKELNTRFFPYSAVQELYALCQKRKLKGVTEEFLDCYMEPVVMN